MKIFAATAPGLESICAGEFKTLGVRGRQEIGGVGFGGDLDRLYEANLWLRTASRVVVRLGSFHASTFYELERRARKLPWADFLPASGEVRLRVTCRKSKLYHSDAVAERVLSAIASSTSRVIEGSAAVADDDSADDENTDASETADALDHDTKSVGKSAQLFVVRIVHDQCEVSADSSGELLHRRGYRQETAKAPLRETLAAAMVLASGWKEREPLLDPMCGSGTIPIEAAMIARRIAPGSRRRFPFMTWPGFEIERWNRILEIAEAGVTDFSGEILGADRDAGAIQAATRNAERAGVLASVSFSTEALSGSIATIDDSVKESGLILTNPPYGVRVGESEDLRNLYAKLGSLLKSKPGWRLGVLTSDSALVRQTRLPLRPRFSTSNGGIPVSFFVSEKNSKAEVRMQKSRVGGSVGDDDQ
ncbi:MAG: class I SAM-dependent RNA methyltransferase [Gemmatimonadota bacterium]|nr:class I SAM-dependent RNA methyltransferase [Gemmatimonadota bacterium]